MSSIGGDFDQRCLEEGLECSVCLGPYENPYTMPCSHTLCKKCLDQLRTSSCPECRASFDKKDVAINFVKDNRIDQIWDECHQKESKEEVRNVDDVPHSLDEMYFIDDQVIYKGKYYHVGYPPGMKEAGPALDMGAGCEIDFLFQK